jgi:hypothetical protein
MAHTIVFFRFDSKRSLYALLEAFRILRIGCDSGVSSRFVSSLLEELVVSHVFANTDVAALFAKIQNFI